MRVLLFREQDTAPSLSSIEQAKSELLVDFYRKLSDQLEQKKPFSYWVLYTPPTLGSIDAKLINKPSELDDFFRKVHVKVQEALSSFQATLHENSRLHMSAHFTRGGIIATPLASTFIYPCIQILMQDLKQTPQPDSGASQDDPSPTEEE